MGSEITLRDAPAREGRGRRDAGAGEDHEGLEKRKIKAHVLEERVERIETFERVAKRSRL